MPLLAVTYVKGRPGATTSALGLAATAPSDVTPVVLECDPAGGDLMRRHGLAAVPSLVDLAAIARGSTAVRDIFTSTSQPAVQTLTVGDTVVPVVAAPAGGAQTRAALPELTNAGRPVLAPADRLVVADCGRLTPGSPVWPVLRLADVVLVLVRARADELAHLRELLCELLDAGTGRLVMLLAHGGVYPAADVAEVLSAHVVEELAGDARAVTVLGPLPTDRRGAAVLDGELLAGRRWRRLPLLRGYTRLWSDLGPLLPGLRAVQPVTSSEVPR
ncbi:hypothetical protein ACQP2P_11325 [Dactylosporangium sp. CA-139114]|uniref:hypothetical protein n=1 Tax=Dactylosporangium sp. CA-139114 TaxID=3239931 RepID=UPI003D991DF3